ncbi:glycosyltransferase [Desulfovibrio sp. JC010]|uniref:glycosyltransferase family 2 protein n=1 Tax=Desulfovibrio sp. JC010 TaxID=2593641 RepID=UPI0013D6C138|nr:glycosyltransferase [Desulfovibrio sp. JC010]NDV28475.1 glycosyltransferase [Desulfovibrio sp. JC010]
MPKASVLLPVYNGQQSIARSLKSLLRQTYTDFEICIINDGSTDGTLDVLSRFSDPRIKIHTLDENAGLVSALNIGIDKIDADYVLRLDADDVCHEDRIGRQVRFMEENESVSLSGTWCHIIDRKQQKRIQQVPTGNDDLKARLFFNNPFVHPSMIFRREALQKHKYSDEYRYCEDYGLWVEMSMDETIFFANIPEPLVYKFENKGENISHLRYEDQLRSCSILRGKLLQHIGMAFSADDFSLHDAVAINSIPDIADISVQQRVEAWLMRLQQANNKAGYIPPRSFDFELAQRWISVFEHGLSSGQVSAGQVLSSPLISSLDKAQICLFEARLV